MKLVSQSCISKIHVIDCSKNSKNLQEGYNKSKLLKNMILYPLLYNIFLSA